MPAPTVNDLADQLGFPPDDRMGDDLAAAVEFAQDRRSLTDPLTLFESARVFKGTLLYAALLYQSRATPAGFPGYEEAGGYWATPTDNAMRRVYQLIGQDVVVA